MPTSQLATNVMAANKANDPWLQVFMAATTVTVAEIDGQVVGVLLATPPPNIARQLGDTAERINPGSGRQALASIVLRLVRLSAVAVSPAYQHTGIAKALISRGVENYRRAGYIAMYGQFESSRQLAPFYEKLGFQVCGAGEDLDFGDVFGPPLTSRLAHTPESSCFAFSCGERIARNRAVRQGTAGGRGNTPPLGPGSRWDARWGLPACRDRREWTGDDS